MWRSVVCYAATCKLLIQGGFFFKKRLSHIWILVYIGTQNVDLVPFGKPPNLHPRIIMDLDRLGIHMHKHTIHNRSDSHLHAYLHVSYK